MLASHNHKHLSVRGIDLMVLVFLFASAALGERLPIKTYTTADGLAGDQINKIVRDSRGFLWFCTSDGLSRFDGYAFTNFGTEQGLPDRNITDLLETRDGQYWIGTHNGLVHFNPTGLTSNRVARAGDPDAGDQMFFVITPSADDRLARAVTVLLEDRSGVIWCGTLNGLFRVERKDSSFGLTAVEIGMPNQYREQHFVSDLLEDRYDSLWIATPGGLYRRWPEGDSARYTERDGLPQQYLHDLFVDRQGQLWVGSRSQGLFRYTADESHKPPIVNFTLMPKDGLPSGWISQLFQTSDDRFWVATADGLIEILVNENKHGQRFHAYSDKNGLTYHEITALCEDAGGNLWLGSNAGAMKLARDGFITYGDQDGIALVNAIFGDRQGEVCFRGYVLGDGKRSVFDGLKWDLLHANRSEPVKRFGCYDGQNFNWFMPGAIDVGRLGWVGEQVTLQGRSGEWWIGTSTGLLRFPAANSLTDLKNKKPLAFYSEENGLAAPQIYRLFEDSQENIWISTTSSATNGLALWEHSTGTLRDLANSPGLPALKENLVRSFGEDRRGSVWIGFGSGLARFRSGQFTFFDASGGLPAGAIEYIYPDQAGRLWLASSQGGLVRIDDPTSARPVFTRYTTSEGLSSNSTGVITADLKGHIYVTTGRGLDEVDPATGRIKHFTTADGLASGAILSAFRDRRGTLWFGTLKGLSRFTPPAKDAPASPPPLLLTGLRVAGSVRAVSALGEREVTLPDLPPSQNQLQVDFIGLSFAPGEVLRYQYKLEGTHGDWSVPDEQRTLHFANLASGQYKVLIRAVNSDGVYSAAPALVSFRILRPVWQRWWFVLLAVVFVSLAVYAGYRYRMLRLLEVERVRTRIATDLHDDIGAGLSRVAILTEVVKQQVAGRADRSLPLLTEIADSSRQLVSSMRDIVWAIGPRHNELGEVILRVRQFASDVLEAKGIQWDFAVPKELDNIKLDPEQRRHLFLIFKEAINNISRYADCQNVRLSLTASHHQLEGEINDDGCGLANSAPSPGSRNGHGIVNMQKRALEIGGSVVINSTPGEGTRIKLKIPLGRRW